MLGVTGMHVLRNGHIVLFARSHDGKGDDSKNDSIVLRKLAEKTRSHILLKV